MRTLIVVGIVAGISSLAPGARAQAPAPTTTQTPPPGYAPPPAYGYPAPGYAYPPTGYAYPPPGYAYPPPPGYAYPTMPPRPRPPGYRAHDGLYLRPDLGVAFVSMSVADPVEGRVVAAGVGVSVGVAAGWAVQRNMILYGRANVAHASRPAVTINGMSPGQANADSDLYSFGGGAAYYFEGPNLYLAASALATKLSFTNQTTYETRGTHFGFGVEGLFGKEWWVSENWGLGLALQLHYASMKDESISDAPYVSSLTWTAKGGAVLFSATYN